MRAITLTLTVLATLAIATEAAFPRFVKLEQASENNSTETVDEVVQGARGFFLGFQGGLYKTDKVDEGCLNPEAEKKILELFNMVFSGKLDLTYILKCVTDLMTISSSLSTCSTKAFTDLATFCFLADGGNCAPETILANIQKNLLLIMGKLTDLSTMVMQGLPKDGEAAYNMGLQAGQDLGGVIRIILGFKVDTPAAL